MPTAQPDLTLTPQQEAAFVYRQEQDPDWWPALLCQHVTSQGDTLAALKAAILADPEEWNPVVARAKANGMGAVRKLAGEKPAQWNFRIKLLLADPVHVRLLDFYLKSLVLLKAKRVSEIGARARARQQANPILAAVADEMLAGLDKFTKASAYLITGTTAGGRVLTAEARAFYETLQKENATRVTNLLGVIFLFKDAQSMADIQQLQQYIKTHLIKPLEIKTGMFTDTTSSDYKAQREKMWLYQKLLRSVEISFE